MIRSTLDFSIVFRMMDIKAPAKCQVIKIRDLQCPRIVKFMSLTHSPPFPCIIYSKNQIRHGCRSPGAD